MDDATRGFIESWIDDALNEENGFVADIEWIKKEIPISSFNELVLGYIIGLLSGAGILGALLKPRHRISRKEEKEIEKTVNTMLKRRLPEIVDRINKELNR